MLGAIYGSLLLRRYGIVLALLCAEVYARRHGIDITLFLLALYLAGIVALGRCGARLLGMPRALTLDTCLRDTVLGVIMWSTAIWVASIVDWGSLPALRVLSIAILGAALAYASWELRRQPILPMRRFTRSSTSLIASLATIVLMLSAKAAVAVDGDALWYGLNADRVLFGDGGLFHAQGLIAHVHYYPKLAESLQAPFLGLGSASLVTGFSLLCWILLVATAREVLNELGVEGMRAWFGAAFACVVPAVAASAATPKGELLAAWLCVSGLLAALRLRHDDNQSWLGVGLAAVLVAPLARLTVLPYATAIFVFIVAVTMMRRRARLTWRLTAPIALASVLALLVCLRTFQQTGVALASPDVLVHLQGLLGWQLHDDVGRYEPELRTPFPSGLLDSLFGPGAYIHQALFWMGNGWLPLLIAALALRGWRWTLQPATLFMFLVGMSMYALLYAYRYGNDGADGNYFIVPIVLLHLVTWAGIFSTPTAIAARPFVWGAMTLAAFCLFLVVTTSNWFPGTGRLDARFDRTPFGELDALADARFRVSGMGPLAEALEAWPRSTRMLGDMPTLDGGYFPVRYESLATIAWARPPLLADRDSIVRLFRDHDIRLVALSHDPATAFIDERIRPVLEDLAHRGEARKLNVGGGLPDLWVLGTSQPVDGPGNMIGRSWR